MHLLYLQFCMLKVIIKNYFFFYDLLYIDLEEEYKSIFESATALDSIQQELCNLPRLKGKQLFFFLGFFFYDYQGGMISINLQDPDQPENIDTYTYSNGEWQVQQPVRVRPFRSPISKTREELVSFFDGAHKSGGHTGKFSTVELYGDGKEYVTEVGVAQIYDANGKMVADIKYMVLWKKTKNGWKMFRDMFSSVR